MGTIRTFSEDVYILKCNDFNTAITDGDFPASGSYINVSDYDNFAFVIQAGTLDSALTCAVQEADAADGTATSVTGASDVIAATDDNDTFVIEVETRKLTLSDDDHFVTLDVSGAGGSNDYLSIMFYAWNAGSLPVTQPSTTNVDTIVAG